MPNFFGRLAAKIGGKDKKKEQAAGAGGAEGEAKGARSPSSSPKSPARHSDPQEAQPVAAQGPQKGAEGRSAKKRSAPPAAAAAPDAERDAPSAAAAASATVPPPAQPEPAAEAPLPAELTTPPVGDNFFDDSVDTGMLRHITTGCPDVGPEQAEEWLTKVVCPNMWCKESIERGEFENHLRGCDPLQPTRCPLCGGTFPKMDFGDHSAVCKAEQCEACGQLIAPRLKPLCAKKLRPPRLPKPPPESLSPRSRAGTRIRHFWRRWLIRRRLHRLAFQIMLQELDRNDERVAWRNDSTRQRMRRNTSFTTSRSSGHSTREDTNSSKESDPFGVCAQRAVSEFASNTFASGRFMTGVVVPAPRSRVRAVSIDYPPGGLRAAELSVREELMWRVRGALRGDNDPVPFEFAMELCDEAVRYLRTVPNVQRATLPRGASEAPRWLSGAVPGLGAPPGLEHSTSWRPGGQVVVVGDLHGQARDLEHILETQGMPSPTTIYVFNGDFVDRGDSSCPVLFTILTLLLASPRGCVHLNRGNHEGVEMNMHYGFVEECETLYGPELYPKIADVFCSLPLCTVIGERVFVSHGGLPRDPDTTLQYIDSIDRFREIPTPAAFDQDATPLSGPGLGCCHAVIPTRAKEDVSSTVLGVLMPGDVVKVDKVVGAHAHAVEPSSGWFPLVHGGQALFTEVDEETAQRRKEERTFIDLLWSDPDPVEDDAEGDGLPVMHNRNRGVSITFRAAHTDHFLQANGLDLVIRSHECQGSGYTALHGGRAVTVFSASNYAGSSNAGAVARIYYSSMMADGAEYEVDYDTWHLYAAPLSPKDVGGGQARPADASDAELAVLTVLRGRVHAKASQLWSLLCRADSGGTGTVSNAEWVRAMFDTVGADLPWSFLQPKLCRRGADPGRVRFASDFLCRFTVPAEQKMYQRWMPRALLWVDSMCQGTHECTLASMCDQLGEGGPVGFEQFAQLLACDIKLYFHKETLLALYVHLLDKDAAFITPQMVEQRVSEARASGFGALATIDPLDETGNPPQFWMWDTWLLQQLQTLTQRLQPAQAFHALDADEDGYLSSGDLAAAILRLHLPDEFRQWQTYVPGPAETRRAIADLFGADDWECDVTSDPLLHLFTMPIDEVVERLPFFKLFLESQGTHIQQKTRSDWRPNPPKQLLEGLRCNPVKLGIPQAARQPAGPGVVVSKLGAVSPSDAERWLREVAAKAGVPDVVCHSQGGDAPRCLLQFADGDVAARVMKELKKQATRKHPGFQFDRTRESILVQTWPPSELQLQTFLRNLDADGDGMVSREDYLVSCTVQVDWVGA
eukprot:TRINITY_DN9350_c0_g1_i1.p1 TRINITY_DN9350_c0_g1~~TRINITY_DN9350_c0_g1_i1.p1  ORF type:complete len:1311 (+),score=253.10 TRINITY_DN9350_c0_g1_i1:74-4006(+)